MLTELELWPKRDSWTGLKKSHRTYCACKKPKLILRNWKRNCWRSMAILVIGMLPDVRAIVV
jgi:hypothetical protein